MAAIVVQQTLEQELTPCSLLAESHGCARQLHLHLVEEIVIEDRRMLPGVALTAMVDLAEIASVRYGAVNFRENDAASDDFNNRRRAVRLGKI